MSDKLRELLNAYEARVLKIDKYQTECREIKEKVQEELALLETPSAKLFTNSGSLYHINIVKSAGRVTLDTKALYTDFGDEALEKYKRKGADSEILRITRKDKDV